jgi:hypothetical protein
MNLSKLGANERTAAIAALVVLVLGVVSYANDWGAVMLVAIVAALAALALIFLPQVSPSTTLPIAKPLGLLVAGVVAAIAWLVATVDYLGWIFDHVATFDTLQFLVGLAAALVLAWAGWQAYAASRGSATPTPTA